MGQPPPCPLVAHPDEMSCGLGLPAAPPGCLAVGPAVHAARSPDVPFTILPARCGLPQVECPAVTPEIVLKASGHVDRFTDFMVRGGWGWGCHDGNRQLHLLQCVLGRVEW